MFEFLRDLRRKAAGLALCSLQSKISVQAQVNWHAAASLTLAQ
jgi:hypothetical protein